jgi:hypothetical protein
MTCASCVDLGVFKVAYRDGSPTDFALCLCRAGEAMRRATNNGRMVAPQWHVWAFRQGIPLDRIAPMEDVLTNDEMAARGFTELSTKAAVLDAVAEAARQRGKRR